MTASLARVPCTVVTGFLGAGKTTLIRNLLENAGGKRLALIVNEFGDVGVDGEILRSCGVDSCPEENIVELANGCICCTVADDFVPALDQILSRTPKVDHIIIETSGLALPKPLVQAFQWKRLLDEGEYATVSELAAACVFRRSRPVFPINHRPPIPISSRPGFRSEAGHFGDHLGRC